MDKNIFVVVEGPDGAGKTSIAKELGKKLGLKYFQRNSEFKVNSKEQKDIKYYHDLTRRLGIRISKELKKSSIIIDRYAYSVPALLFAHTKKKESIAKKILIPDYVIYCYANKKILRSRINERLKNKNKIYQHEEDLKKYKRLCKRYKQLFRFKKDVIKINTSKKSVKESVDKILKTMELKD